MGDRVWRLLCSNDLHGLLQRLWCFPGKQFLYISGVTGSKHFFYLQIEANGSHPTDHSSQFSVFFCGKDRSIFYFTESSSTRRPKRRNLSSDTTEHNCTSFFFLRLMGLTHLMPCLFVGGQWLVNGQPVSEEKRCRFRWWLHALCLASSDASRCSIWKQFLSVYFLFV